MSCGRKRATNYRIRYGRSLWSAIVVNTNSKLECHTYHCNRCRSVCCKDDERSRTFHQTLFQQQLHVEMPRYAYLSSVSKRLSPRWRTIGNASSPIYRRSNSHSKLEYHHVTRRYTHHYHRCQSESNSLRREPARAPPADVTMPDRLRDVNAMSFARCK